MNREEVIAEVVKKLFDLLANRKGLRHLWNVATSQQKLDLELQLALGFIKALDLQGKTYSIDEIMNKLFRVMTDALSGAEFLADGLEIFTKQAAPHFYFTIRELLRYSSLMSKGDDYGLELGSRTTEGEQGTTEEEKLGERAETTQTPTESC